jgi:hypothetical protein
MASKKKHCPQNYKGQTKGWPWWRKHSRYAHRQCRRETRVRLRQGDPDEFLDPLPHRFNAKWEGWMS